MEGDSKLIMDVLARLLNGSKPAKISPSWRLLNNLEFLNSLLVPNLVLIMSHIWQDANKLANKLANEGVKRKEQDSECS